jgi:hypothetical protein
MPSTHYIDWEKAVQKFDLKPDGYAPDNIGMVPVFKIAFPQGYLEALVVYCNFLDAQLNGTPAAWIIKQSRVYTVMTNVSYTVFYKFLQCHDKKGLPLYVDRKGQNSVQYGPFKSMIGAVKKLRELIGTVQNTG